MGIWWGGGLVEGVGFWGCGGEPLHRGLPPGGHDEGLRGERKAATAKALGRVDLEGRYSNPRTHPGARGRSPRLGVRGRPPGKHSGLRGSRPKSATTKAQLVELWGFEPQTSSMPWRR